MKPQLALVSLGPLLLLQGLYVRRTTPRLPEPEGARDGQTGTGPALRLMILGDSAAAGVGAASQSEALTGHLTQALAPHFSLSWQLHAQTGRTTAETLEYLESLPALPVDVVVTSLGVNDITGNCSLKTWLRQQAALVQVLQDRFQAGHVFLSALPPMHAFPALPQPLRWYLGTQALRFNQALADWAGRTPRCSFVPLEFPLDPALMASDGFHPGPGAYRLWADHLSGHMRPLLMPA